MHLKQIVDLIKKSVTAWVDDYAPSMGAALAYGAQIFLLGAEFTWVYSNTYGSKATKGKELESDSQTI